MKSDYTHLINNLINKVSNNKILLNLTERNLKKIKKNKSHWSQGCGFKEKNQKMWETN